MLLHRSCLEHMGRPPIIVVHGGDEALVTGFQRIVSDGGRVQRAPNFRHEGGLDYVVRNQAGSLLAVETDADYVALCDPDMLFLRMVRLEPLQLRSNQISFERVSYLYLNEHNRHVVVPASKLAGVDLNRLVTDSPHGGVPHVVPAAGRKRLAREWLHCLEYFAPKQGPARNRSQFPWTSAMWALVFAVDRLGLEPVTTRFGATNFEGWTPPSEEEAGASLLHYCYGDHEFDKRRYQTSYDAEVRVWRSTAQPGSINAQICAALQRAGRHYGLID